MDWGEHQRDGRSEIEPETQNRDQGIGAGARLGRT